MKKLALTLCACMLFVLSCNSGPEKAAEKSRAEKEIDLIAGDYQNKEVSLMVKLFEMKKQEKDTADRRIVDEFKKLYGTLPKHALDKLKDSPNKSIEIPAGTSKLHIKNNYTSGNSIIFIKQGSNIVFKEYFQFNTEKHIELNPGNYEFIWIIDRKFNNNKYMFTTDLEMADAKLYIGEFNIKGALNKSGECAQGEIMDEDTCLTPEFRVFDNCESGTHLVVDQCCEEGFNFIMDGKCSRYSATVETVVCPAGYIDAGKGRCCPMGHELIDDKCQIPPKKEKEKEPKKEKKK